MPPKGVKLVQSAIPHRKITDFFPSTTRTSKRSREGTAAEAQVPPLAPHAVPLYQSTVPPPTIRTASAILAVTSRTVEGGVHAAEAATSSSRSTTLCRHFSAGYCRDGAQCMYSHTGAHISSSSSSSTAVCKYFCSERGCRSGSSCPNRHYNDFGFGVVHVPWSEKNVYRAPSGKLCSHWTLLTEQLFESEVTNTTDLGELLVDLLPPLRPGVMKHCVFPTGTETLVDVLDVALSAAEREHFFHHVLPFMKNAVLQAPTWFPDGIPILRQGVAGAVRISETQALILLCCAFFSLFPGRHHTRSPEQFLSNSELQRHAAKLGYINFGSLYAYRQPQAISKTRCILSYFQTQYARREELFGSTKAGTTPSRLAIIEIIRCVLPSEADLELCTLPLGHIRLDDTRLIEAFDGVLQADFANATLGGGVLHRGCVQEEIRFATAPELLLSRLVCETMRDDEAIIINGASDFVAYRGYASTFAFEKALPIASVVGALTKTQKASSTGASLAGGGVVRNVSVVAFDAINYNSANLTCGMQYQANWVRRDVEKALVAFSGSPVSSLPSASSGPIATGNWGCGAFGGDPEMKLLQQWAAASACRRSLEYCTFGNVELTTRFAAVEARLRTSRCTVRHLYRCLMEYHTCRKQTVSTDSSLRRRASTELGSKPSLVHTSSTASATSAGRSPLARLVTLPGDELENDDDHEVIDDDVDTEVGDDGSMSAPPLQRVASATSMLRYQTVFEFVMDRFPGGVEC